MQGVPERVIPVIEENDDDPDVMVRLAQGYSRFCIEFDWDDLTPAQQEERKALRERQRTAYYRIWKDRATD